MDSVPPSSQNYNWSIPDSSVTNSGIVRMEVSDWGDNVVSAQSDGFITVTDATVPSVSVLYPNDSTSVKEYDSLTVRWEATVNIGLDSIFIYYSNAVSLLNSYILSAKDSVFS